MTMTIDLLEEYAAAARNFGEFGDGSDPRDLYTLAELATSQGVIVPLDDDVVLTIRHRLGLCREGEGHWEWECSEHNCPTLTLTSLEFLDHLSRGAAIIVKGLKEDQQ